MKSKKIAYLLVLILLISSLTACVMKDDGDEAKQGSSSKNFITIATGGTAGAYYPLGGALSNIYNTIDGITANSQTTGASVENIGLVANGEAEVAFVQNDVTYHAWEGIESFNDKEKLRSIRGLSMLYPEVIQLIAREDSNIKSVEDLRGKKVAVGAAASGTEINARQILELYGLSYDDINQDFLSFSEAADQLKNKQIDAAFVTAALPTSAVTEVSQTSNINIVPIDRAKELVEEYPYYSEITLEAGTYKNNDEDINTLAVMAMLIVPEDLDEDLAYQLTKEMFEQKHLIEESHARGKDIKLENALVGMPIEVHPGAKKYYDEKGIK